MFRAGDCAWVHTPITGTLCGGAHMCVCLSTPTYANGTGHVIVVPLRRPNRSCTGLLVQPKDLLQYTASGLDQERILDLSQMYSVPRSQIGAAIGRVHAGKLRMILHELSTMTAAHAGPLQGQIARVEGLFADGRCVVFDVVGRGMDYAGWHVVAEYAHGNPRHRFATVASGMLQLDGRAISALQMMDFQRGVQRALGIDQHLAS